MLVLDADGRVLESNAAAEHWLSRAGVVRTRAKRIRFTVPAVQHAFAQQVAALVASPTQPASSFVPGSFHTATPRADDVVMHLCGVPPGALVGVKAGARVLVFIAALVPDQVDALAGNVLRQTLGLTPTEARVALALRRQSDVAVAAHALGLRPATVHAHLRNIHARLGIGRTADLLMMMERLLGSFPGGF
jgi:DNA-binding CsgD family transcriptional regulator